MHRISIRALRLAPAVCLMLAAGNAAMAQPANMDTRSVTVSLKGIDLASRPGRALAQQRIAVAAREACDAADTGGLRASAEYARCRAAAVDDASSRLQALVAAASPAPYAVAGGVTGR